MQVGMNVALSGQMVLQRKLETLAHNLANATTPGFRAKEISFTSILAQTGDKETAFAGSGEEFTSLRSGGIQPTGNPLDVAVMGDAWLALRTDKGAIYTKDGRMQMLDSGELRSVTGLPLLDVSGTPILLDPAGGPPRISRDGMVTQNGNQIAAIGLFRIDPQAKLTPEGTSGFSVDRPAFPVLEFAKSGLAQGSIETSNVNTVMEMARLIDIQRAFDSVSSALDGSDNARRDAIKTLGPSV